ncbi:BQ2448_3912 [Microbotryum intermedium]|uniref:BQ2448_3912 protein n=1 Tax=Microbotryum intermedium TaxID=269621 RepID=A0A238FGR0_9BASI|nr:BQ2448_3912 [Microbotryum intermedium]
MHEAQHANHLPPPPIAPVSTQTAAGSAAQASHSSILAQKIVLAGVSNMASSFVVKVRQQLQPDRTTTIWATTMRIMFGTEGPLSLYKGLSASMLREMTYSGLRMGAYDSCKAAVLVVLPWAEEGTFATKLTAGMASGMLGAALKVRMQSQGATGTLRWHVRDIVGSRGVTGLYRAIAPTVLRAGILTASQLGTYDHAKHTLMNDFPDTFREGFRTHFIASGVAGFTCSIVSSPGSNDVGRDWPIPKQSSLRGHGFAKRRAPGLLSWSHHVLLAPLAAFGPLVTVLRKSSFADRISTHMIVVYESLFGLLLHMFQCSW